MRGLTLFACTLALCPSLCFLHAQGVKGVKAVFHVTAIQMQDHPPGYCDTGACSAKKFTVEGYVDTSDETKSIEYVLTCVELLPHDLTARYAACARVRANNRYSVTIASDWIQFDTHEEYSSEERPNYLFRAHDIVSERVESKQAK